MTPLTQDPKFVALVDKDGNVLKTASNIAADINVVATTQPEMFEDAAQGMPFVQS